MPTDYEDEEADLTSIAWLADGSLCMQFDVAVMCGSMCDHVSFSHDHLVRATIAKNSRWGEGGTRGAEMIRESRASNGQKHLLIQSGFLTAFRQPLDGKRRVAVGKKRGEM